MGRSLLSGQSGPVSREGLRRVGHSYFREDGLWNENLYMEMLVTVDVLGV